MRTLILNKFLHRNGGSETYIFKLGEALEQHGHEVQYFGMEHEGRCVGNRVNAYTSDMDFHGGSKLSKLTYPIKTIYSKEARVQLRKVLDDFKPDVCHLNNFNYQLTPSIILEIVKWRKETGRNCKIIFTAHDYQLVCPNHIRNLVSNQEYQRPLSENHIRKALEEFDVYQINPVKVSRRDGINYVFDGQHTIEIIASESGSRDTPVWCMIYDDLKYKEEAHIFADQQKHVKALSSFETFKAHIEADDPKQKMIEAIVQSYGLAITSTKAKNGISAVSTLERIYDKYGQAVLDTTLRLAIATWEGENNSLSGSILMGIARIVVAYGDSLKEDVFKDHVGRVSVKAIIRAAKERRPGALGYSEAMIIEYNKKSKFRLSLKTLYGGKQTSDEDEFGEE